MRHVLITGGTGFVGTHLLRFLKSTASVAVLASSAGDRDRANGVIYYDLDIRSADDLRRVLREFSPAEIYHLAAISAIALSWTDPRLTFEVNVVGTYNLLEAAMSLPSPPRILNISTAQVYAPSSMPLGEASPIAPCNPYAATKAMAELNMVQYQKSRLGGVITARAFNHTGPGQATDFVLPSIAKQFAEIELGLRSPVLTVGNLDVSRDFTDVRDVVGAYCALMNRGRTGEVYNVCSGVPLRLADVVAEFELLCKVKVKIHTDPARCRVNEITCIVGDRRKIENETGWKPEIPLQTTLRDLLDYWRQKVEREQQAESIPPPAI